MQDNAACRGQISNRLPQIRVSSLEANFDSHIADEAGIRDRSVFDRKFLRPWRDGLRNGSASDLHPQRFSSAHRYSTPSLVAFENKEKNPSQNLKI